MLTFLFYDLLQYCLALLSRRSGNRQEDHTGGVLSKGWEFEQTLFLEEFVWCLDQEACAVTAIRVTTRRAAMLQVAQNLKCVFDNLMRSSSLDVSDKTHATSVVLVAWVVETLF